MSNNLSCAVKIALLINECFHDGGHDNVKARQQGGKARLLGANVEAQHVRSVSSDAQLRAVTGLEATPGKLCCGRLTVMAEVVASFKCMSSKTNCQGSVICEVHTTGLHVYTGV